MTETTKYIGGEYKVLQQFGGAMGHVFLVEKQGIGFPFVLKSYQDIKPHLEELDFFWCASKYRQDTFCGKI